ncbi:MAG: hypothetical protein JG782_1418 [Anaerophaga sp.]|nr:hypothetical protein [Anaerophaga sp.]MDK2841686.1 hypothetical protein [Anaerophaga sp.]
MELACKHLYIFLLWYALSCQFYLTSYHLTSKNLLKQSLPCSFHPNNNALLQDSALKMRLKTGRKYTQ